MIPARYAQILFGFLLSGFMSFVVSGVATLRAFGFDSDLLMQWMAAWSVSWMIAFPAVLIVAPVTRRLVARMVRSD